MSRVDSSPNSPHVILMDNDWMVLETDAEIIRQGIRDVELDIIRVRTGLDFVEVAETFKTLPPKIILANVNLRAMDPIPNPPNLAGSVFEGSYDTPNTVGLRCLNTVQDRRIALVVNTHFSSADLDSLPSGIAVPERATVLYKGVRDYTQQMVSLVRAAISR